MKIYKRIAKIIFLLLSLCASLYFLGDYLSEKTDRDRYIIFFREKPHPDVLFLGTSSVVTGVSPLDLWNEYGILSFNLAGNGQSISNNYWVLKNALNVHKPKVVVFELDYIGEDEYKYKNIWRARVHQLLDSLPISVEKYKAIFDLIPLKEIKSFLLPQVMYYHDRWKNFELRKKLPNSIILNRGGQLRNVSKENGKVFDKTLLKEPPIIVSERESSPCLKRNEDYIIKIVNLCNHNNIKLVFFTFPRYESEEIQKMYNYIGQKISAMGVEFINCQRMITDFGFNYSEDMRDYSHLNISGNKKITSFVGCVLQQRYEIKSHKGEAMAEQWNNDFIKFSKMREKLLKKSS